MTVGDRFWVLGYEIGDHPARFRGMTGLVDEFDGGIIGWFHDSDHALSVAMKLNGYEELNNG